MSTIRLNGDRANLALNGSPTFLGVIVATTTKNNHDTVAAFNNTGDALKGKIVMIQSDAACYVLAGSLNTSTVTTANGVKLAPDERVIITMSRDQGWLAGLAVSGTANIRVWSSE